MKKTALAVAGSVLAVLMVLPVVRSVNLSAGKLSAGKPVTIDQTLRADGSPQPLFPPKPSQMLVIT